MTTKRWFLVIALNLVIALLFFVKNLGVGYSQLTSDQQNIVPMCMKLDNPELYKNDLFLNDIQNFQYYTPFFVKPLQWLAQSNNGNYISALNIKLLICHLLFGLLWFYLCFLSFKKKFWLALFLSILLRGIVWLPGGEIWGISDLWTIMPRTVYSTLLPIPFILLAQGGVKRFLLASLVVGLIFNFHAISGLGGILFFVILIFGMQLYKIHRYTTLQFTAAIGLILLGTLPFLSTYFTKTSAQVTYDLALYYEAFDARIPSSYQNTWSFLSRWFQFKTVFIVLPLISLLAWFWNDTSKRATIRILLLVSVFIFVVPLLSIPIETAVNNLLGSNIRMSFQLIRIQKLIILPAYFAMGTWLLFLFEMKPASYSYAPYASVLLLTFAVVSQFQPIQKIPLISNDIVNRILPSFKDVFIPISDRETDFDKMAAYVQQHTPEDAVFYANYQLRSGAKRAVDLDIKGASILIESNPKRLITWYQNRKILKSLSQEELEICLKSQGMSYVVFSRKINTFGTLIKKIGVYQLHRLE